MVMLELDSCDRGPRLRLSRQGLPISNSKLPTHPLLSVCRHTDGSNWMNYTKGRLHATMAQFGPYALDVRRLRNYRLKKLRVHNHSGAAFLGAAFATKASSPNPFAGTERLRLPPSINEHCRSHVLETYRRESFSDDVCLLF
jgi:hypothetical protein